ncbi:MAG: hypothetical protein Kow0025_02590 [Thermodesulfovibrionales bacterium]
MVGKRIFRAAAVLLLAGFLALEGFGLLMASGGKAPEKSAGGAAELAKLRSRNVALKRSLAGLSPKGVHIVIDTSRNLLTLRKGDRTLLESVVSTGSGNMLREPGGERKWVFDTPRGEYAVKSKVVKPSWVKPDWAFIEEGTEIPRNPRDRVEPDVLGDYALGFGNGYFIHGTLYTRLLGRNVTHGCIRVGDKDLETIYKTATLGTRIIIF